MQNSARSSWSRALGSPSCRRSSICPQLTDSRAATVPAATGRTGSGPCGCGFSIFTRRTFLAYGIALLPFFVFDYWFYAVEPMLTEIGLLDVVGNIIMLWLCWIGWKRSDDAEHRIG